MMACVNVPRFDIRLSDDYLSQCISVAVETLGYRKATREQVEAIRNFVLGRDVFVSLPTGSGKSLCYAALPLVFDNIRGQNLDMEEIEHSSIVVCVSPLSALMLDQVTKFNKRGLLTAHVGHNQKDVKVKTDIEKGRYQLVLMSPESLLLNLTWREMFRSSVYHDNLAGLIVDEAHLVEKW